jgi:hypothetical protein
MKRAFALLPVVGAVSMVSWLGCGGSTGDFTGVTDEGGAGSGTGGGSGTSGSAGVGGGSATVDGGPSFDPGTIGGLVGGGKDGGATAADGGIGIGGGVITPEVVDGCNSLCVKEAAVNCPNQGPIGDCVVGCRLILNNAKCSAPANALFACEKTSPAACDNQGKATLTGCGVEQLTAAACFLQNATDPTLKAPCMSYCSAVAAANCPMEDPAGCASGCPVIGNFIPACNMYWKAYVTCASTAMITCGMDGKAGAPGCAAEGLTYLACTAGGVTNTGDAGR